MAGFDFSKFATGGATRPDTFSGMQPQFQSALANMFAAAPPDIQQSLRVKSGYRSPERQTQLWNQALQKYGSPEAARKWVAPPGRSQHNHGNAADLGYLSPAALDWAHKNAKSYGLAFPLANENWHVELAGARGGHNHGAAPQAAPQVAPSIANAQNHSFDPVGEVMAMKQPGAAPSAPPMAPQGLAAMMDPLAGGAPVMPDGNGIGSLALLFAQQQQAKQQQQADEQAAEETRRAALFAPDSLAGLFGA